MSNFSLYSSRYDPDCTSIAAAGAFRGAFFGGLWGLGSSAFQGYQYGLRGQYLLKEVGRGTLSTSLNFAAFLGIYSAVHCRCERSRQFTPTVNAAISGGVAGGLVAVPHAYITRNPRLIVVSAAITSAITTALSMFRLL